MTTVCMLAYDEVMAILMVYSLLGDVISYLLVGLPTALRVRLLVIKDSARTRALVPPVSLQTFGCGTGV
jgi:hypothetical protein